MEERVLSLEHEGIVMEREELMRKKVFHQTVDNFTGLLLYSSPETLQLSMRNYAFFKKIKGLTIPNIIYFYTSREGTRRKEIQMNLA
ncbi:unnamed protein product [Moneuplotes crassus]|uniref:Uncharacterized protein n=1 Tax=Euplotes crassus TaxID=5936 RepID=A0AAD2D3S1_EUPCR|nr:unnamed protein product [Moneuplotes crassus]